jgi:DNA-binding response OmpR family regulator
MPGQLSERLVTPILAVELDDLTLERLRASVRGTELALLPVSRDDAVEHAVLSAGPLVVLLEWLEGDEEEETRRFCEMLRRTCKRARCHILALGSLPDEAALLRAMAGPVDDVLSRPFGGDLALRLRRALRIAGSGRTLDHPRDALDEALASPTGGEVAVRSGDVTAFIHVQDGHVVWANVSSVPASMEEVVRHAGVQLDRDLIAAVKAECRASNKHFMDVLVTWSVVDEARAREAVRVFVAGRVEMALALPGAAALFLPRARPRAERIRIRASEIPSLRAVSVDGPTSARFDTGPPSQSRRPPLPLVEIAAVVQQAAAIEGAMGAAILDRNTGASLYHTGHEADSNVAWSQLTTLAALGPSAEDVMAADGERCFITRPLRFAPSLALFVALSLSATTLGLSRMTVARIAAHREGAAGEVVSRGREG